MVRAGLLALALAALPLAGRAQVPDWSQAGGALLILPPRAAAPEAEADRLRPPDQPYDDAVRAAADRYGLDPKLVHAVVLVESGYRATAVSAAGAEGLTQLMPGTARGLGVRDPADPAQNLAGGAAYLARQLVRFQDLRLALAAYNAGPERVARLGRTPAIPETQAYVTAVVECYLALTAGRSVRTPAQCRAGRPTP